MSLTIILFLIGVLGFVLNRKNIILMLISIEIMLLSITFLILVSSLNIDDIIGQTYAIYIIVIAGAESAIGLGILVAFYRLNSSPKLYPYFIAFRKNVHANFLSLRKQRFFSTSAKQSSADTVKRKKNFLPFASRDPKCTDVSVLDRRVVNKLCPSFITGLIDAEGSFVVTILKNSSLSGWMSYTS